MRFRAETRLGHGSLMYAGAFVKLSEEETARSFDFKEGVGEETRTRPRLVNGNDEACGSRTRKRQLGSWCHRLR